MRSYSVKHTLEANLPVTIDSTNAPSEEMEGENEPVEIIESKATPSDVFGSGLAVPAMMKKMLANGITGAYAGSAFRDTYPVIPPGITAADLTSQCSNKE